MPIPIPLGLPGAVAGLKWKDVIENLESAVDGLQKLANIIESTVLKHT